MKQIKYCLKDGLESGGKIQNYSDLTCQSTDYL